MNMRSTESNQGQRLAYTIDEFRAMFGQLARATVYAMISRRELRTIRIGSRTMIPSTEIDRVLSGQRLDDHDDHLSSPKARREWAAAQTLRHEAEDSARRSRFVEMGRQSGRVRLTQRAQTKPPA